MKKFLPVIGCVAALSFVLIVSGQAGRQAQPVAPTADAVATQKALVGQYCVTCHSDKAKAAGMDSARKINFDSAGCRPLLKRTLRPGN
jgi:mono/diheme cytochrome c family protein